MKSDLNCDDGMSRKQLNLISSTSGLVGVPSKVVGRIEGVGYTVSTLKKGSRFGRVREGGYLVVSFP